MIFSKSLICSFAFFSLLLCFATANGDSNDVRHYISYNAEIFDDEKYSSYSSPIDPDNVFGIYSGVYDAAQYYLDFKWKSDPFSIQACDIGFTTIVTNFPVTNYLSEIYASYNLMDFYLDLGKKKVSQSMSFLVTPMDFAMRSYNDVSRDKSFDTMFSEGKYMANLDWYTDIGQFGFCYIPEIIFSSNLTAYFSSSQNQEEELRYNNTISGIDFAFALNYDTNLSAGTGLSTTIGDFIEAHAEGVWISSTYRYILTTNDLTDTYSPLLGIAPQQLSNIFKIVLGGSYNGDPISIMLEYYYNSSGFNYSQWNDILNAMKDFRSAYDSNPEGIFSPANLGTLAQFFGANYYLDYGQNFVMIRLSPSRTIAKFSLTSTTLMNLDDLSGVQIFNLTYCGWEHLLVSGTFSFDFGSPFSGFMLFAATTYELEFHYIL